MLISTLDQDTVEFLESYLEQLKNSRTIIIISGDHGMRYGEMFKKIDGAHEHRLPLCLILASKALLSSIPFSIDTLYHNSNRLTSKLDLYNTQLHMINSLDEDVYLDSKTYENIRLLTSKRFKTVSLLLEKIPNNRTCESIGIPAFWCSCLKFEEVNTTIPSFIHSLAQEVVDQINEESYLSRLNSLGRICQKLNLNKIFRVWVLSTDEEYYKIQFTVKESKTVLFESVVLLT